MELQLPIPEIRDDVFRHSYKKVKSGDSNRLRPPKLKPRHHNDSIFNRSHSSSSAHFITFRSEHNTLKELPSTSSCESYFDQCFTKISKIGEGSFGEVFKVRCKEDGLHYAVKMSKQLFRSENYRQERLEEVKRYEQFSDHENCVRFYKAWEQYDRLYMQMELCRENLEQYIERRRHIPEDKIWSILLDLLLALKSLHDKNLIHLDIKLDNVLVDDDESCKLGDFGLVVDVDKANRTQVTEGDSRYIAPELMQGYFSKAADIFSLGIAILELSCCLELPANGPLWQQLRSGMLPDNFINKRSVELQSIIKLMMAPQPDLRPTVDELLNNKKLVNLLRQRRRWEVLKKVKQAIRYSRRVVFSKLCNLRKMIFQYFDQFFATFRISKSVLNKAKDAEELIGRKTPWVYTPIISLTPTSNDERIQMCSSNGIRTDNTFDELHTSTPTSFTTDKILNSTPLNQNQGLRSRKDLTKTSFTNAVDTFSQTPLDKTNSFLCLDDVEAHSCSFTRHPLDSSSLRKKLFSNSDDSD